jgi:hypothetical protein
MAWTLKGSLAAPWEQTIGRQWWKKGDKKRNALPNKETIITVTQVRDVSVQTSVVHLLKSWKKTKQSKEMSQEQIIKWRKTENAVRKGNHIAVYMTQCE